MSDRRPIVEILILLEGGKQPMLGVMCSGRCWHIAYGTKRELRKLRTKVAPIVAKHLADQQRLSWAVAYARQEAEQAGLEVWI